ncbi:MAG TPA: hypothetical protein VJX67_24180 [Blastocatellia bacterium]|nr:hypothetical protein [Blastocatellia bacterium]
MWTKIRHFLGRQRCRALVLAFVSMALSCVMSGKADATIMQVQSQTLRGIQFPGVNSAHPLHVRVFYSPPFVPSDAPSTTIMAGTPNGPGINNAHQDLTSTLVNGEWVMPAFTLKSADDALDDKTSQASFFFFGSQGNYIGPMVGYTNLVVRSS